MTATPHDNSRPLCVDLDGTLVATDTLGESVLQAVRHHPLRMLASPWWLTRGRAYFKRRTAELAIPDPALLPYRDELVLFLRNERDAGRRLLLTTGSDELVARPIADHLGLFDTVIASDGHTNCTGSRKVAAISQHLNGAAFDYIGNSCTDLPVWSAAAEALVVSPRRGVLARLGRVKQPQRIFEAPMNRLVDLVKAMRPEQWAKNLLLLVPMLVGHHLKTGLWQNMVKIWIAFVAFGMCASFVYLLNDLLDIDADRRHPNKRFRPIAAGRISLTCAIGLAGALAIGGEIVGYLLVSPEYALMLLLYMLISSSYSMYFKRKLVLDVICLAALYTHRIVAGGVALHIAISEWLLAFAMFLFLSLAFVKRYGELVLARDTRATQAFGRNYRVGDLNILRSIGPTSGYMAVLVFCLYIQQSKDVAELYAQPRVLWAICPILLYWITRIWFLADRHGVADDPLLFALRDKISYFVAILIFIVVVVATTSG